MELNGAKILYTIHTNIPALGDFKITQTLVSTWIVMALLSALAFWLGRDLKLENVSKRQAAAEFIVERLDQFVHDNMGWHFDKFIPLVGAIFALSIGCNLISVVGLWSPTADLNTEAAWAIVVFIIIMYYKIKTNGILAYLKGLLDPIFLMAPINVLSEVSTPVSMAFRHFGNILSGTVISTLLYWALASLSHVIFGWLPGFLSQLQLFQIGIPAFTGLYFMDGGCGAEDYLILQLRLRKGLSLDEYKKRYGREFSTAQLAFVQNCVKSGYANFDGHTLALTPAGLIVQNSILAELL